mgnify:CR=1 FL=1
MSETFATKEVVLAERFNMGFSSTLVSNGRGLGLVTSTGMDTEVGHIASKRAWGENYNNRDWTRWQQAADADQDEGPTPLALPPEHRDDGEGDDDRRGHERPPDAPRRGRPCSMRRTSLAGPRTVAGPRVRPTPARRWSRCGSRCGSPPIDRWYCHRSWWRRPSPRRSRPSSRW